MEPECEVSVVMPCLNEERSIGTCIEKAQDALRRTGVRGEVVVADNGSTDRSVAIAESLGARVVHQQERGYGNAYMKGFAAARGKYIVMADSDNTYDFGEIEKFVKPLREGCDMVMGTRLKGTIMPGAMPFLHRYIGNPFLSWFLNLLFRTGISDSHCGMRSFTKEAYEKMRLKCGGMEFASEMVIKASKARLKIAEVPITLYANKDRSPHLNTFRDGWRHMRLMVLYSPMFLFFVPGLILFGIGLAIVVASVLPLSFRGVALGPIFMVSGNMFILIAYQVVLLGLCARVYMVSHNYDEESTVTRLISRHNVFEVGTVSGLLLCVVGIAISAAILVSWLNRDYPHLSVAEMKTAIISSTLMILGVQTIFMAFLMGILKGEETN